MSNETAALVDEVFRNRWRTLLSVDDMVAKVHKALEGYGMLENTYFLITSDHGYHLGQFGMPLDKRLPYEFDIRVPLWVAGPNITANQSIDTPVLSIDIAPTLLALAGLPQDITMDGERWNVPNIDLPFRPVPPSPGPAQHHRPHPRPPDRPADQRDPRDRARLHGDHGEEQLPGGVPGRGRRRHQQPLLQ